MAETTSSTAEVRERIGIPAAAFVEDVQSYLDQLGVDVNSTLAFLQERLQQYKLVEMKLLAQHRELQVSTRDKRSQNRRRRQIETGQDESKPKQNGKKVSLES